MIDVISTNIDINLENFISNIAFDLLEDELVDFVLALNSEINSIQFTKNLVTQLMCVLVSEMSQDEYKNFIKTLKRMYD